MWYLTGCCKITTLKNWKCYNWPSPREWRNFLNYVYNAYSRSGHKKINMYSSNRWESIHRDVPTGHKNIAEINCAEDSCWLLGYTALNEEQTLLIVKFIDGRDVFVVLLTGYYKSLCFACLLKAYNILRDTTGSIGLVMPLIVMTESMVTHFKDWLPHISHKT